MLLTSFKFQWLVVIISYICFANARQIRYSRYNTEVIEAGLEDGNQTEEQATVREINSAPYPASGVRLSKAFPLPNESSILTENSANVALRDEIPATTPATLALITSTPVIESDITTTSGIEAVEGDDSVDLEEAEEEVMADKPAPYPAAGFKPRIPFLLPTANLEENKEENLTDIAITEVPEETTTDLPTETATKRRFPLRLPAIAAGRDLLNIFLKNQQQPEENEESATELSITEVPEENTTDMSIDIVRKAPYPAAGYRPSKAFLLPNERLTLAETEAEPNHDSPPKEDNSKHPVCGSSTNPLAPKPLDDKEDPDSETIFLNGQIQRNQQILNVPIRYRNQTIQPLLIPRPFLYTTHIQSW